jgi:hypothetical protein
MVGVLLLALGVFLGWRFLRPMNIFVVDDRFAWPITSEQVPPVLGGLSAPECGACHTRFLAEWRTSMHSQAWTDPYFQADWQFEGSEPSCRLCHTPLDRQQPRKVLGYRDTDKWDPILADNPDFDSALQHEGVSCAACHYREGKILGVLGTTDAPHPVQRLEDPNQVCVRCHVVEGDRWDTFFRFPPCGTVAEIRATSTRPGPDPMAGGGGRDGPGSGEILASDVRGLHCVSCHMPLVERPLVEGGPVRTTRRHLWRGGHDPQMVKSALSVAFEEVSRAPDRSRLFQLTISNTGAAHYVPTGTPDRHLTVRFRVRDARGMVLQEQDHTLVRSVMWRPFIVDLRDTRLPRGQPRRFQLEVPGEGAAASVEVEIRYHLLAESRRRRIGYANTTPIDYPVFRQRVLLGPGSADRPVPSRPGPG